MTCPSRPWDRARRHGSPRLEELDDRGERPVFVTGCGAFLPGEPVSGDQAERLLGCVDGRPSRLRRRVLAANGIATRHYALDPQGNTTKIGRASCRERV